MISLIICSREPEISRTLKDNISETIGVDYELIVIDNSNNQYSIFSAYNEGVRRAKYPYLCFMHDDILYYTSNWGEKVIEHFQNENVGLIGVFGSHILSNYPFPYWSTKCLSYNIIQRKTCDTGEFIHEHVKINTYLENKDSNSIEVAAIDGFWFCMLKKMFDGNLKFDEELFSGFHAYDMDISLQVIKTGFQVVVVFDILIEHFSLGKMNVEFKQSLEKFCKKHEAVLPIHRGTNLSESEIKIRYDFVNQYYDVHNLYHFLLNEKNEILNSKTFRLGEFLLRPFYGIHNRIKNYILHN